MTTNTNTSPQQKPTGDAVPRARKDVFAIIEREGKKAFFQRIGSAFENRDGSLNVLLDALPKDGRLNIRDPKPTGSNEE